MTGDNALNETALNETALDEVALDEVALDQAAPQTDSSGEDAISAVDARVVGLRRRDLHPMLMDPLLTSMTFLNEIAETYPDAISLAAGRPHNDWLSSDDLGGHIERFIAYLCTEKGMSRPAATATIAQYGRTNGHIHELIARTVANDEGIEVSPDHVVVTVGAQEAILIVLRALIADPRDVLLVASPCYVGITGAAAILGIAVEPVQERPDGLAADDIRVVVARLRAEGRRPRAIYLVADCANPSGLTLSENARRAILGVADELDLVIIEDNPYGLLVEPDAAIGTLKSLDTAGRVVYLGSFSKSCFPGARVGYVLADQKVTGEDGVSTLADELAKIKSLTTLNTPGPSQAIIGGMLIEAGCNLRAATAPAAADYRRRLVTMLAALQESLGPLVQAGLDVEWNSPRHGYFVVVSVPFDADEQALAECARRHRVLWTPMRYFCLDRSGDRRLRLSCSSVDVGDIDDGVRRLAAFVDEWARR